MPSESDTPERPDDRASSPEGLSPLQPARYDPSEGRLAFAPNRRWGLFLLGVSVLAGFFLIQIYGRIRTREALREQLLLRYEEETRRPSAAVSAFLGRLDGWIQQSANGPAPESHAAEGFRWSEMHDWRGLYLRIEEEHAVDIETIHMAARGMGRDAITRCLGVSPVSARGLYDLAQFLDPSWADELREEDDTMRLRVLEDQMTRHLSRDVPLVESMLRSDYFLLVVTRGGRVHGVVDAFVWDLHTGEQLMSTRTRANGRLLTVQYGETNYRFPSGVDLQRSGAVDCSIAAAMRAVAGEAAGGLPRRPPVGVEEGLEPASSTN